MRAKSLHILMLSAAGILTPAANAHPHKATVRPAASAKSAKASKSAHAEKAPGRHTAEARHPAQARHVAEPKGHHSAHAVEVADRHTARGHHLAEAKATPERKGHHAAAETRSAQAAPKKQLKPEPVPEETPVAAQGEIHVTHDRKQRHSAPATPPPADTGTAQLRKATPQDFLSEPQGPEAAGQTQAVVAQAVADTVAAAPLPVQRAVVRKLPAPIVRVEPDASAQPEPVVSVVRKSEARPEAPTPDEQAVSSAILPTLFDKRGKLIVPPAMKGSHEILVHQNVMADQDGLDRIQDDQDLARMRDGKLLVSIPESAGLRSDDRLPANRRYARPWTASFLSALARAHYDRFHTPLQVNSAVRTVEFQQKLLRTNGNAAPAGGETASPHLTGQAVDLAKHGLSMTEIAWLRGYLGPLVQQGKVDVEEEFQQACFHISVYRKYMPQPAPKRTIVAAHSGTTGSIAAAALR